MGKIKENTLIIKVFDIIEFLFKLCFLIYGLASFNSFLAHTKFIAFFLFSSGVLAGILLVYRVIHFYYFIHSKLFWLSMTFLVSYIVSFLLNIEYANINGIKTLVFMGMQFCLLLATDKRKSFNDQKRELKAILTFFNSYMFVSAVSSIVLFFCKYSNIAERNGQRILSGFVWGRLWGVFVDPNYGSVLAAMALIISLYAIKKYKNLPLRIVNVLNICAQILYIAFSDSRTGLVVLLTALFVYFICRFATLDMRFKLPLKSVVCVILAVCVSAVAFFAVSSVDKVYNAVFLGDSQVGTESTNSPSIDDTSSAEDNPSGNETSSTGVNTPSSAEDNPSGNETSSTGVNTPSSTEDNPSGTAENSGEKSELWEVGREQDIESDISNRRFDLWKSAIETVKVAPFFGVSFESIADFAEEHLPETYLINNDHGVFNNYHNVLFNVLVGQGIVGISILFIMIVYAGISLIKAVCQSYGTDDFLLCAMLFALLVMALVSSMFLSDVIYAISVNMMLFWYLLGILLKKSGEVNKYDKNQHNSTGI